MTQQTSSKSGRLFVCSACDKSRGAVFVTLSDFLHAKADYRDAVGYECRKCGATLCMDCSQNRGIAFRAVTGWQGQCPRCRAAFEPGSLVLPPHRGDLLLQPQNYASNYLFAAPLGLVLAAGGAVIGYVISGGSISRAAVTGVISVLMFALGLVSSMRGSLQRAQGPVAVVGLVVVALAALIGPDPRIAVLLLLVSLASFGIGNRASVKILSAKKFADGLGHTHS